MAEYVFVSCFSNKFGAVRFSRNPEKSLANSCGFDVLFRYSVIYANLLGSIYGMSGFLSASRQVPQFIVDSRAHSLTINLYIEIPPRGRMSVRMVLTGASRAFCSFFAKGRDNLIFKVESIMKRRKITFSVKPCC